MILLHPVLQAEGIDSSFSAMMEMMQKMKQQAHAAKLPDAQRKARAEMVLWPHVKRRAPVWSTDSMVWCEGGGEDRERPRKGRGQQSERQRRDREETEVEKDGERQRDTARDGETRGDLALGHLHLIVVRDRDVRCPPRPPFAFPFVLPFCRSPLRCLKPWAAARQTTTAATTRWTSLPETYAAHLVAAFAIASSTLSTR